MSNYLTEPEAWQEIAQRIAGREWRKLGLCAELYDLCDEELISDFTMCHMEDRVESYLNRRLSCWAYEPGTEPEARILAALWLALEAEEDDA